MNRNIFVGDFNGKDNVIIFNTTLNDKDIETILAMKEIEFSDVMEIPDEDIQYYCYDPLFATPEWDEKVRKNHPFIFESLQNTNKPK
ncbi:MAG: hypothetical protein GX963_09220 [Bacteroidales bacterium]|nr:hypothetical protein [Bacteroidales bacterium]